MTFELSTDHIRVKQTQRDLNLASYARNKDKILARNKEYYKANKEMVKAIKANARFRRKILSNLYINGKLSNCDTEL